MHNVLLLSLLLSIAPYIGAAECSAAENSGVERKVAAADAEKAKHPVAYWPHGVKEIVADYATEWEHFPQTGPNDYSYCAALAPDGSYFARSALRGYQPEVKLLQPNGAHYYRRQDQRVYQVADRRNPEILRISPNSELVATGRRTGSQGGIMIWRIITSALNPSWALTHLPSQDACFRNNETFFSADGHTNTIELWDISNERETQRFKDSNNTLLECIAVSPDLNTVANSHRTTAHKNAITLFDIRTGKTIKSIPTKQRVYCMAYKPDGNSLIAGEHNGRGPDAHNENTAVRVWDLRNDSAIKTFAHCGVRKLALTADGARLVTGGMGENNQYCVKLWNSTSGDCLATLEMGEKALDIINTNISADGTTIMATAVQAGIVHLWRQNNRKGIEKELGL